MQGLEEDQRQAGINWQNLLNAETRGGGDKGGAAAAGEV